ncbi:MBL fold metallo-hydrolase, partial [Candidatus Aerophobetes bacterium]|nr:MBL fold metallo-hydrolase [Candidatus Aerophobetes bacterium]
LKEYRANVIYMLYNEDIDSESANIALATENPDEVNTLLSVINNRGYNYKVVYRGSDTEEVERIIGLKLVEKFFLRLRKLVSDRDVKQLMAIVDSSRKLYSELVNFYSEVGNHPEKGDVFSNVLAFASTSIVRLGKNFKAKQLTPLQFNTTRILTFCLPTGGNIFVFQHDDEFTMFDAGYGLYYEDFKSLLVSKRINPSRVKRIFVSHADADHIGCAGYFSEEFGAQVFIHPDCKGVMDKENRGYGANTQLSRLNKHFTMLVNRFTQCKYPKNMNFFPTEPLSKIGVFNIIHTFRVGSLKFEVLESQGGHVPGQVFFLNREHGLIFTSDYLINVESLSDEEREYLKLPRYLMTSTNTNSQLFREESKHLIEVIFSLNKKLKEKKSSVIIFPGHGNYYSYQEQFSIC